MFSALCVAALISKCLAVWLQSLSKPGKALELLWVVQCYCSNDLRCLWTSLMFLKAHGPRSPSSGCGVYRRCSSLEPGEWLAPDEWLTSPSVSWSQRSQRMVETLWICLNMFAEICWIHLNHYFFLNHIPHNDIKISKDAQGHRDCCTVPKLFDWVYVPDPDLPHIHCIKDRYIAVLIADQLQVLDSVTRQSWNMLDVNDVRRIFFSVADDKAILRLSLMQDHSKSLPWIQQYPTISNNHGSCSVHLLRSGWKTSPRKASLRTRWASPNTKSEAWICLDRAGSDLVVVAPSLFSILFVEDIRFLHAFTGTRNVWINEDTCIVEWHLNENGMIGTKDYKRLQKYFRYSCPFLIPSWSNWKSEASRFRTQYIYQ